MKLTEHYLFKTPEETDLVRISDLNENTTKIDGLLANLQVKTYHSLEQIGVDYGAETMADIATALPVNSVLQMAVDDSFHPDAYPSILGHGQLVVRKSEATRCVFSFTDQSGAVPVSFVGSWTEAEGFGGWVLPDTIQVGDILVTTRTDLPDNYVLCNGAAVPPTEPELRAFCGPVAEATFEPIVLWPEMDTSENWTGLREGLYDQNPGCCANPVLDDDGEYVMVSKKGVFLVNSYAQTTRRVSPLVERPGTGWWNRYRTFDTYPVHENSIYESTHERDSSQVIIHVKDNYKTSNNPDVWSRQIVINKPTGADIGSNWNNITNTFLVFPTPGVIVANVVMSNGHNDFSYVFVSTDGGPMVFKSWKRDTDYHMWNVGTELHTIGMDGKSEGVSENNSMSHRVSNDLGATFTIVATITAREQDARWIRLLDIDNNQLFFEKTGPRYVWDLSKNQHMDEQVSYILYGYGVVTSKRFASWRNQKPVYWDLTKGCTEKLGATYRLAYPVVDAPPGMNFYGALKDDLLGFIWILDNGDILGLAHKIVAYGGGDYSSDPVTYPVICPVAMAPRVPYVGVDDGKAYLKYKEDE